MANTLKPIRLYGERGPNPPKVEMILSELDIPYELDPISMNQVKLPEYEAINPNGRVPSIIDPNNGDGLTLWESGAILEYLIERYDDQHLLSYAAGTPESYLTKQWLYFQATGQGPYFGQAVWFKRLHPERIDSAVERYVNEVKRVSSVLDKWLSKQKGDHGTVNNGPWLVGDRITYADISFIPWQRIAMRLFEEDGYSIDEYPHLKDWYGKLISRPKIDKVINLLVEREKKPH